MIEQNVHLPTYCLPTYTTIQEIYQHIMFAWLQQTYNLVNDNARKSISYQTSLKQYVYNHELVTTIIVHNQQHNIIILIVIT